MLATKTEDGKTVFYGGSFWDGRATGVRLGNALAEQALGPFVNPLEQNLADGDAVVAAVCAGSVPSATSSAKSRRRRKGSPTPARRGTLRPLTT